MDGLIHLHLTVNARISPKFSELPKDAAQQFVNELLRTVGMKPLGQLQWADAVDLDFPGQSMVQMITTSHCSLHFFAHTDGTNEIYFDLYSCKPFDTNKVIDVLDKKFGLEEWHGVLYHRATGSAPKVKTLTGEKNSLVMRA